jgi:hypothetical protein
MRNTPVPTLADSFARRMGEAARPNEHKFSATSRVFATCQSGAPLKRRFCLWWSLERHRRVPQL